MSLLHTSMQGKVCLITGANSGIGNATALGRDDHREILREEYSKKVVSPFL